MGYMMCDQAGKWHANAACVTQNESPEDRRSAPPRTTGTLPTRAEETRQTTRQAIVTDSANLRSNEPASLSTEAITTNIRVVSHNESPEDRRSAPPRTTGTLPTRAEETRQTTRQAIVTDSATLKSSEPASLSTEAITT